MAIILANHLADVLGWLSVDGGAYYLASPDSWPRWEKWPRLLGQNISCFK